MVLVVLTELLSDPKVPSDVVETISEVPLIEVASGYWQRAGALRAKVLATRRKARLGDALIAQSCIDQAFLSSRGTGTSARSPRLQNSTLYLGSGHTDLDLVRTGQDPSYGHSRRYRPCWGLWISNSDS